MSIRRLTCHFVSCDACRTGLQDDDEGFIPHFDTPEAATDFAADAGWHVDIDGHLYCPRCIATVRCVTDGHDYTPWMPCVCRGRRPDHALFGCGLLRYCQRGGCDAAEAATLATLPTTDEPTTPGR